MDLDDAELRLIKERFQTLLNSYVNANFRKGYGDS